MGLICVLEFVFRYTCSVCGFWSIVSSDLWVWSLLYARMCEFDLICCFNLGFSSFIWLSLWVCCKLDLLYVLVRVLDLLYDMHISLIFLKLGFLKFGLFYEFSLGFDLICCFSLSVTSLIWCMYVKFNLFYMLGLGFYLKLLLRLGFFISYMKYMQCMQLWSSIYIWFDSNSSDLWV